MRRENAGRWTTPVDSHASRALLELSRTATGEWNASIQHLVQVVADVLHVERASFWSISEETSSIHCDAAYVAGTRFDERGPTLASSDLSEYFAAMRDTRVLNIEDVGADSRMRGWRDYCAARGVSSVLDVPVWVEGRLAGFLCHEHVGSKRRWSTGEEEFAKNLGPIVSSALAARAHTRSEAAAHRAAFLDTCSRLLFRSLDLHDVARRAVDLVVPKLADGAHVWVQNRDGVLECLATTHVDPEMRDLVAQIARIHMAEPERPSMQALIVRQKQAILVREVTEAALARYGASEVYRTLIAKVGIHTTMGVPLAIAGNVFGAMTVFAADRRYDGDDLALVNEVGERVAAALENARLYQIAREAIRARDELLILAAHELRTPVTALQLSSQDLLRRAVRHGDPGETARSETIARHVRRLSALIEHILDALRIRAQGVALARRPCDLAAIVESGVEAVKERARNVGQTPIEVRARAPVVGTWDRASLERVLHELLDNAIKFGGGRPIEVAVDRDGTQAVLTVRDYGVDIKPERLSSIFSPFERAVSTENFGGLGLGLYIARAIVEAHGGSIAVTSGPSQGTTFVVRLPLVGSTAQPPFDQPPSTGMTAPQT